MKYTIELFRSPRTQKLMAIVVDRPNIYGYYSTKRDALKDIKEKLLVMEQDSIYFKEYYTKEAGFSYEGKTIVKT